MLQCPSNCSGANSEVPTMAVVTERLMHEETKMKSRSNQPSQEEALTTKSGKSIISAIGQDTSKGIVKSLQRSRVRASQTKPKGKPKWGHSR